jgi:hypothetical protein
MVRGAIDRLEKEEEDASSRANNYLIDKQSDQAEALNIGPSDRRKVDRGVVVLAIGYVPKALKELL